MKWYRNKEPVAPKHRQDKLIQTVQVAFSDEGSCTNQAESFFSRLRRAEFGQHHHISGPYLRFYAGEMAWREDMRRESNGVQWERATAGALSHGKSRNWCGYWQRAH